MIMNPLHHKAPFTGIGILTAAWLAGCSPAINAETPSETPRSQAAEPLEDTQAAKHDASSGATDALQTETAEDSKTREITYELSADGPAISTHCKNAHVTVSILKDGKPSRAFESDVDLMGNNESATCIMLSDLNFDGIQDVLVPTSIGMHNAYYRAWLWHKASGAFEEIPGFSKLGAPIPHPETQSLEFTTHISAAEYETAEYRLEDKVPAFWRSLHFVHDPDSGEVTRTSRIKQDGQILEKISKIPVKDLETRGLDSFQKEDAE